MAEHETQHKPAPKEELYCVLAEFEDVDTLMHAAEKVRDAGYSRWDTFSPFPIHGIEEAMGVKSTILPWIVLGGGLAGLALGIFLQVWTMGTNVEGLPTFLQGYKYIISGKPFVSLPAFIPVAFETTILLSAFAAVFGMLALNRLPQLYHPVFKSSRFRRVTNDRFFIAIEADDPKFDPRRTREFLGSLGASSIEEVED